MVASGKRVVLGVGGSSGSIYAKVLMDDLAGPLNLSAPEPARTRAFVKTMAEVMHRPAVVRVPAPLVKLAGGELAQRVALKSARMLPERLLAHGFRFATPDLRTALAHLLGRLDAHTLP